MKTAKLNRSVNRLSLLLVALLLIVLPAFQNTASAQETSGKPAKPAGEDYGNTLNLGLGIGYFGYLDQSVPFVFANYEFDVAKNITVAPFIGIASYRSYNDYPFGGASYYYHETVVPIGAKGTYYFDDLLGANPKWDFYGALSLGFVYDRVVWDNGYNGDKGLAHTSSPLFVTIHAGAEYHFNSRIGMFLDLSTGVSTIGLSIHHR